MANVLLSIVFISKMLEYNFPHLLYLLFGYRSKIMRRTEYCIEYKS